MPVPLNRSFLTRRLPTTQSTQTEGGRVPSPDLISAQRSKVKLLIPKARRKVSHAQSFSCCTTGRKARQRRNDHSYEMLRAPRTSAVECCGTFTEDVHAGVYQVSHCGTYLSLSKVLELLTTCWYNQGTSWELSGGVEQRKVACGWGNRALRAT